MRRRRWALAWLLVGATGLWVEPARGAPSYAALRQARPQEVPGTLGVLLVPPPADFDPSVTPQQAYRLVVRSEPPGGVVETLALVSSPYAPSADELPAWVVISRGVCRATSKCDLVSAARSGHESSCTNDNLIMNVVDARTGEGLAVYRGYDPVGTWEPALGTD